MLLGEIQTLDGRPLNACLFVLTNINALTQVLKKNRVDIRATIGTVPHHVSVYTADEVIFNSFNKLFILRSIIILD